jgi:hypothetical protein
MNLRGFEIGTSGFSLAALPAREDGEDAQRNLRPER